MAGMVEFANQSPQTEWWRIQIRSQPIYLIDARIFSLSLGYSATVPVEPRESHLKNSK